MLKALVLTALVAAEPAGSLTAAQLTQFKAWLDEMRSNERGPYQGVAWYCNDGTEQLPKKYACVDHGGGKQYGVLKKEAKKLAEHGLYVGTVLASLEPQVFRENDFDRARAYVIESFLERALDGWVLHKARDYRGFRQTEDEEDAAREILMDLMKDREVFEGRRSLALRLVRAMPYGKGGSLAAEIRTAAGIVGDADPAFANLRYKIHAAPEPADIPKVEAYAARTKEPTLAEQATELAKKMREFYDPATRLTRLREVKKWVKDPATKKAIDAFAKIKPTETLRLVEEGANLIATAAGSIAPGASPKQGERNLLLLHVMQLVEELWIGVTAELTRMPLTRLQTVELLGELVESARELGYLSARERSALEESFVTLQSGEPADYASSIATLGRMLGWAHARVTADVGGALTRYSAVEPRAAGAVDDILRGGLMLPIGVLVDRLNADVERLRGGGHRLVGLGSVGGGALRGENPGMATGVLKVVAPGGALEGLGRDDIALLFELPPELPPVAGILTVTAPGSLSHVSLLARNLGIPLAAVGADVAQALTPHAGASVVIGVSMGRRVVLGPVAAFPEAERAGLAKKPVAAQPFLEIDAKRLDLKSAQVLSLTQISEQDSGVRVGPKAGELGRLKRLFPTRVSDAAVIPFGAFVRHVDRPGAAGEPSPLAALRAAYARAAKLAPAEAETMMLTELERFRAVIASAPFASGFAAEVETALNDLGAPGSFGVFVRSDTNVEDLKDFTGAGLNLTVPNRVGLDNVLAALREVWASPYTERSYRWRQRILKNPELVFPSVVLHRTVPSELSGVMVTVDLDSGDTRELTVSVGEGVAAVVDGGSPETVVLEQGGTVKHLASYRSWTRKVIPKPPAQGVDTAPATTRDPLLGSAELAELRALAAEVLAKIPMREGKTPWDIEFGMVGGKAFLMQIRPLKVSRAAAANPFLTALDARAALPSGPLSLTEVVP